MRVLYSVLLYLLLPLILLRLLYRSLRNPAYRHRIGERFGFFRLRPEPGGIWIHAVSVGEAIAAVKLVKALQQAGPAVPMTVTCGTPTGSQIIQAQLGERVGHIYAPYDLPGSVSRFMRKIRPRTAIIMETELWPNLFRQAKAAGVRLMISNLRLSDRSFERYARFPAFVHETLSMVDCFAAQTAVDAERIIALGADPARVEMVGNLKFELESGASSGARQLELRQHVSGGRLLWLAGSTHEGEDLPVLQTHAELLETYPDLLLILAPRHPERFADVFRLSAEMFETRRRTQLEQSAKVPSATQVLILDTIGELSSYIAISDWVFIGGSLVPVGGHNILEACQAGVAVIYGPHMENFRQVAQIVGQGGAGIQLNAQGELTASCRQLAADSGRREKMGAAGKTLMAENRGAIERTLALIERL